MGEYTPSGLSSSALIRERYTWAIGQSYVDDPVLTLLTTIPKRYQGNNGRAMVFFQVPFLKSIIRQQPSLMVILNRFL